MSTPLPTPTPQPITIGTDSYQLVAFYFPGKDKPWDMVYNAPFLGNFWLTEIPLTINGESATFKTAEAAFQATKWWDKNDLKGQSIRGLFSSYKDGDAAFKLRQKLAGDPRHGIPPEVPPDSSYAGLGRDGAMRKVLEAKFSSNDVQNALLATGNAYLLEHNATVGRDNYWSDDHNGCGENMLGKLLMDIRATLPGGQGEPTPKHPVIDFTYEVEGDSLPPKKPCP